MHKILQTLIIIESTATLALAGWSAYASYHDQDLFSIYLILGAIFMGRGQVVRQTAREIRAEMEKAGVE
jgi:hypothetical protein